MQPHLARVPARGNVGAGCLMRLGNAWIAYSTGPGADDHLEASGLYAHEALNQLAGALRELRKPRPGTMGLTAPRYPNPYPLAVGFRGHGWDAGGRPARSHRRRLPGA